MRRERGEVNIKKMLFITGSIYSILLIAFIITSFMYGKQNETQLSKFNTNIIDEYNTERINTETEIETNKITEQVNNEEEPKKMAVNTSNVEEKVQEERKEEIKKAEETQKTEEVEKAVTTNTKPEETKTE